MVHEEEKEESTTSDYRTHLLLALFMISVYSVASQLPADAYRHTLSQLYPPHPGQRFYLEHTRRA